MAPDDSLIPLFYNLRQISASDFQKISGAEWIEENLIPSDFFRDYRGGPLKRPIKWIEEAYQRFVDHTPEFFTLADSCESSQAGLGVFARRSYAPFQVIGEYLGEYTTKQEGEYVLSFNTEDTERPIGVDAGKYANAMSRINDSFPNVYIHTMRCFKGLPYRALIMSLESIQPGEQFCVNYGKHQVKMGPHLELRRQAAREFILSHEVEEWKQCMNQLNLATRWEWSFENISFLAQFRYFLQTPSTLLSFLFDGCLTYDKGCEIFKISAKESHIPHDFLSSIAPLLSLSKKWRAKTPPVEETERILTYLEGFPLVEALRLIRKACA